MKLNLEPRELLSLYAILHMSGAGAAGLGELYDRIEAYLLDAVTNRAIEEAVFTIDERQHARFEAWCKLQEKKVAEEAAKLANAATPPDTY